MMIDEGLYLQADQGGTSSTRSPESDLRTDNMQRYNPNRRNLQLRYNLLFVSGAQDIRVSSIGNGKDGTVEELSASSSQGRVVSRVMVYLRFGQHGHVFNFRLAQVGAVAADEDHLGLVAAQQTAALLVAETDLTGTHNQFETTVHGVLLLFLRS